ncbi:membrane protein insertion efficiency factor YidD [Burkholderia ubonensis]|uniref:membrane protein insertion efficiency factor YidD n=1 Tax=Burkholderia ubonensis TaxID=101571 RepID=UPI0012F8CB22|nr:membrane protein insertion efficiency factor YidD [Burkholderia ubonensis]
MLYVITVALVRFAPERTYRPRRPPGVDAAQAPPPELSARGDRIIHCAIGCYRHSWIRSYVHRKSDSKCRFIPSCSEYAEMAVRRYGLWRGLILIGGRFRRCRPDYRGDYVDFP